jgi:hypothetical protein
MFGPVATMIERDDHIPPLAELLTEMDVARGVAQSNPVNAAPQARPAPGSVPASPTAPTLAEVQHQLANHMLDRQPDLALALIKSSPGFDSAQRLGIYHHAYRARLSEVLADTFAKTNLFMGSDVFGEHAAAFAVSHPPLTRSLSRYGAEFPAHLASLYPGNPELHELAQLDWDLRTCFDGPDVPALDADSAQADPDRTPSLRPRRRARSGKSFSNGLRISSSCLKTVRGSRRSGIHDDPSLHENVPDLEETPCVSDYRVGSMQR